jgi:hypothetical protein
MSSSQDGWPEGDLLNSADTGSFDGSDSDVTGFSPASTPGVSDDVIVLTSFTSVSDGGDGVIELSSALWVVEDSRFVALEWHGVGFNSDGSWSLGDGGLKLGWRLWGNRVVRSNLNSTSDALVLASTVFTNVWVVSFDRLGVGLIVVEGKSLETTLASVGNGVAVDKLLLGEAEKISILDLVVSLNSSGGRESPA